MLGMRGVHGDGKSVDRVQQREEKLVRLIQEKGKTRC